MVALCVVLGFIAAPISICFANNLTYPLLIRTDLPSFLCGAFIFSLIGCGVPVEFLFLSLYVLW